MKKIAWLPPDDIGVSSCPHTFDRSNTVQDNDQDTGFVEDIFQRVEIQVQDPQNATGIFDLNIGVYPKSPPEAIIQSPQSGVPLYKDIPVNFVAHISDEDHPISTLQVQWESDLDGLLDIDLDLSDNGVVEGLHYLQEGSHILSLMVIDPLGGTDTVQTFCHD